MSEPHPASVPSDVAVRARRRIRWLVLVNVIAGCAVPFVVNGWMSLFWMKAASAISLGQYMLVPCWVGLGIAGADRRWLPLVGGAIYLTVVQLVHVLARNLSMPVGGAVFWLGALSVINLVVVSVMALIVAAFRAKFAALHLFADPAPLDASSRWQLSLREIFVITLVAAVLLGLARYARITDPTAPPIFLFMGLYWIVLATAALCAIWAALAPGRIRWRVVGLFAASIFLGGLMSMVRQVPDMAAQVMAAFDLVPATAVVLASLVVVRSCGYRLIARRERAAPPTEKDSSSPWTSDTDSGS